MNIIGHRATPGPLMQPNPDMSLPYVVATDHAIWGTHLVANGAAYHADRVALTQPFGERVIVTLRDIPIYSVVGTDLRKREADRG